LCALQKRTRGQSLMYKPLPWWTLNIVGYAFDPFGPNN
jgi:hypothetical protein